MSTLLPELLLSSGILENQKFTICYGGSRGEDFSSKEWGVLGKHVEFYGFDADPKACEANNLRASQQKKFFHEEHIPLALWSSEGKREVYISRNPCGTSLLQPNRELLDRFACYGDTKDTWTIPVNDGSFETVAVDQVQCTTLDAYFGERGVRPDVVMLDVQGAEYEVLAGGTRVLSQTVCIALETMFAPLYKGQRLFTDIDVLLRDQHGLDFFDFDWIARGRRRRSDTVMRHSSSQPRFSDEREQLLFSCEAYWFRDLIKEIDEPIDEMIEMRLVKLACIASLMKFTGFALEIIEALSARGRASNSAIYKAILRVYERN